MHVNELDTPALVVDLDLLEGNIGRMSEYCAAHGLSLRPHIKTHKMPPVAKMQTGAGARGITVAKVGEAEVMAGAGLDDILVAYPVWGGAPLKRLAELACKARVTVAADSLEVAAAVAQAARAAGARIGLLSEFDAGMRRCGVQTIEDLVRLSLEMSRLSGAEFLGFLFYPGHVREPLEAQAAELERIDAQLREAQDRLYRSGVAVGVVSGGSTPTAMHSHAMKTLTEIRPGTYVFNDMNTVTIGAAPVARCALSVHVTVVSLAVRGRAVVDGGSKTFSGDLLRGGAGRGYGYCLEHPALTLEALTEEHGHVSLEGSAASLRIGQRLRFIPNHVCTAVNMHDEVWVVRGSEVMDRWPVEARGRIR